LISFFEQAIEKDQALTWLERGYEQRDFRMTLMSVAWGLMVFDPSRGSLRSCKRSACHSKIRVKKCVNCLPSSWPS